MLDGSSCLPQMEVLKRLNLWATEHMLLSLSKSQNKPQNRTPNSLLRSLVHPLGNSHQIPMKHLPIPGLISHPHKHTNPRLWRRRTKSRTMKYLSSARYTSMMQTRWKAIQACWKKPIQTCYTHRKPIHTCWKKTIQTCNTLRKPTRQRITCLMGVTQTGLEIQKTTSPQIQKPRDKSNRWRMCIKPKKRQRD